jgi:hypothetical protein
MINFTINNIEKYTCGNNNQETPNIMIKHIPLNLLLEKIMMEKEKFSNMCTCDNPKHVKDRNMPLFFNDRKVESH